MEQEFKITKDEKKSFLFSGFVFAGCFFFFVYYGIQAWPDPSITFFRKYIFIPWFIFYSAALATPKLFNAFRMKITISDECIRYEAIGINIDAKWSDIVEIRKYGARFLDQEAIVVQKWNVKRNAFGTIMQFPNRIPIHYFSKNWRNSKLGQQIKQHVPHLFEKEKSVA
jgi:hypothetical protein